MEQELFIFNILFFLFSIVVLVISLFLLFKLIKSEKIARPFLLGVFIYFILLAIANFQQLFHNIIFFDIIVASGQLRIYTTFWVFLLTSVAPIYLIYETERLFFVKTKIGSKYHLFSLTSLILFIIYLIRMFIAVIHDASVIENFNVSDFTLVVIPLIFFQVTFFILVFLYLAIKSTDKYRLYALMVNLGWLLNYLVNLATTILPSISPIWVSILLILKCIGVIMVVIGFYSLYSLKS